jgi:hypothetical protein
LEKEKGIGTGDLKLSMLFSLKEPLKRYPSSLSFIWELHLITGFLRKLNTM